jgi:hypothetical protein
MLEPPPERGCRPAGAPQPPAARRSSPCAGPGARLIGQPRYCLLSGANPNCRSTLRASSGHSRLRGGYIIVLPDDTGVYPPGLLHQVDGPGDPQEPQDCAAPKASPEWTSTPAYSSGYMAPGTWRPSPPTSSRLLRARRRRRGRGHPLALVLVVPLLGLAAVPRAAGVHPVLATLPCAPKWCGCGPSPRAGRSPLGRPAAVVTRSKYAFRGLMGDGGLVDAGGGPVGVDRGGSVVGGVRPPTWPERG